MLVRITDSCVRVELMQKFYLILLSSLFAASTSVAGVRFIVENGEIGSGEIIVDKNNKLVVNGEEVVVTKSYDETTEKQQISEPMIQYI